MLRRLALGALATAAITVGTAHAQDDNLARSYLITPKIGQDIQFDAALSAHAALRRAELDPWSWTVYTIETGPDAGSYFIRSGDHRWADFDGYDVSTPFQQKVTQHWNNTVSPLVGEWSSTITRIDTSLSAAPMIETSPPGFANVTAYYLRPEMQRQFGAAVGEAHAALQAAGWSSRYLWAYPVSGAVDGPMMWLVTFSDNWAGMAGPSPSFDQVMTKAMGEAAFTKWGERFLGSIRSVSSFTMRYRPDLSVIK